MKKIIANLSPRCVKKFVPFIVPAVLFVFAALQITGVFPSFAFSDDNFASVAVGPVKPRASSSSENGIEFLYKAAAGVKTVSIAGEFNGWNPSKDFLKYNRNLDIWTLTLPIAPGKYEYKFLTDGEWMEGPNLTVEVVKDKSGRVAVKETAAIAPNTPYSGKINFSGRFISEIGAERKNSAEDFSGKNSFSHLDLDWKINISGGLRAFARMEYAAPGTASESSAGGILLRQANIVFSPSEKWTSAAYYASRCVQFDDPLKIMDRPVSLRYDEVKFSDEANPQKAFGLWEQTILVKINSGFGDIEMFYSDLIPPATNFTGAGEDNFGARYRFMFEALPLSVGMTARITRGAWWPWANMDNNWFPDPENIYGYSLNSSSRSLASVWYRGYVNKDFYSIDGRFGFLPGLDLWAESGAEDKELKSVRISGDLPSDKRWRIEHRIENIAGAKYDDGGSLAVELSYKKSGGDFTPPLYYSSGTYATSSDEIKLSARIKPSENFLFALSVASVKNADINGDNIPLDLHPYSENLIYSGLAPYQTSSYGGRLIHAVKEKTWFFSSVNFSMGIFSCAVKNNTSLLKTLSRYLSDDNGVLFARAPAVFPVDEWMLSQSVAETNIRLVKPLSLVASLMHFYVEDRKSPATYQPESVAAYFVALKADFSSDIYLRLGWGLDPEGTDDDISADFDRRDVFLYNQNSGDIIRGARALSDFNRISIRGVLKF